MKLNLGALVVAVALSGSGALAAPEDALRQAGVLSPSDVRVAMRASRAVIAVQIEERRQAEQLGTAELLPMLNELRRVSEAAAERHAMGAYLPRLRDQARQARAPAELDGFREQLERLTQKRLEIEAKLDAADTSRQARLARRALERTAALEADATAALDLPGPQQDSALAGLRERLVGTKHGFDAVAQPSIRRPTLRLVPETDLPKPARTLRHERPQPMTRGLSGE